MIKMFIIFGCIKWVTIQFTVKYQISSLRYLLELSHTVLLFSNKKEKQHSLFIKLQLTPAIYDFINWFVYLLNLGGYKCWGKKWIIIKWKFDKRMIIQVCNNDEVWWVSGKLKHLKFSFSWKNEHEKTWSKFINGWRALLKVISIRYWW